MNRLAHDYVKAKWRDICWVSSLLQQQILRIAYCLGQLTYSLDLLRSVFIRDMKYLGEELLQLLLTSHMK